MQVRNDGIWLENLAKLIEDAIKVRDEIDELFHESGKYKQMFHDVTSLFIGGSVTLTAVIRMRAIYIFINGTSISAEGILYPGSLLNEVKIAAKVVANRYK
jgi:hypothetical protein